jgi:hypothetical protein
MNKRIDELAKEATTYIEPTTDSGEGWIFNKEKFAELIVRECAKQVKHLYRQGGGTYGESILEHFGFKP